MGHAIQYAKGRVPRQGLLQDMRVGSTGPHISVNGLTYICTAMCSFTKFVVAWPIRDKKATTVARGLMERVILPLGSFRALLTDNGKEFENELCHEQVSVEPIGSPGNQTLTGFTDVLGRAISMSRAESRGRDCFRT